MGTDLEKIIIYTQFFMSTTCFAQDGHNRWRMPRVSFRSISSRTQTLIEIEAAETVGAI